MRRVERLEGETEKRDVGGRGAAGNRLPSSVGVRETNGEVQDDDNPLAVFYGIDTQSLPRLHESSPSHGQKSYNACHQDRLPESSQQLPGLTGDLQPPFEDTTRPGDDSLDFRATPPKTDYGWESTQQFKDMQRELAELRAMCRTQDPRGGNGSADATQRAQDTIVVQKDKNMAFSDATTEAEAEYNDAGRVQPCAGISRGSLDALRWDLFQLPGIDSSLTVTQL